MNKRIQINPNIMVGKPTIKGTRIPVYLVLNLLKHGYDFNRIIDAYPDLTKADIKASLTFAEDMARQTEKFFTLPRIAYA